ncbi:SDR family oxidoreductase [Antrihabitans sp. YC3-6]|uniref:SDR family oxidoreductase n=1 Tax=Antrihabitans stalagmiti TaxID=2799499 RepID=A0A934U5A0_9NOCA|nr:SDR family oxidoreductase [Antrihabitans stalagmiti]MBJ8341236.1 SDR family oxidoreductase [Antrihabitans stalagmiti]
MKHKIAGQRIVVTGAARGIGEQVARLAVARGARVALIGLETERLRALAVDLGSSASWCEADVRDGAALRAAIDASAAELGGIDIVVANAGVVAYGTVRQADEDVFVKVLDVNLNGTFRTLKYATPHLERSRGHVVVVASALSFLALPSMASYGASKAGVEMLAVAYRQEVAHLGITVGLVHPSWIDTDPVRGAEKDLPSFVGLRKELPYPGNVTTSVDKVAGAIVDSLGRRSARVYVPRAVGVAHWSKAALSSPVAWLWAKRFAAKWVPSLEREVDALGRTEQLVPPPQQPAIDRTHLFAVNDK